MSAISINPAEKLSRLPLHDYYERTSAQFKEVEGWLLPSRFRDLAHEINLLEHGPALVDFSDHGVLSLEGKDTVDFLHRISTNDFNNFRPGDSLQSLLTTEKGKVIDAITVIHRHNHLLLIVSRGAQDRVKQWIERFIIADDVNVVDRTGKHLILAAFHPQHGMEIPVEESNRYAFRGHYFGNEVVLYCLDAPSEVPDGVRYLFNNQAGDDAFEIYRIQHGIPFYKKEMGGEFNPFELNLWSQISFSKGCYIGQEVIARLDTYKKIQRALCRVRTDRLPLPDTEYFLTFGEKEIGKLTSFFPEAGHENSLVGLAVVKKEYAIVGSRYPTADNTIMMSIEHVFERIENYNGNHNNNG